jgi:hypothetical protein
MDLKSLSKKLKSGKYAISLGNCAYTPLNKELTKWKSSDEREIECSLDELIDKQTNSWFKDEVNKRIEDENWEKLLTTANIPQEEYDVLFLKETSMKNIAMQVRKISKELMESEQEKFSSNYILDARKNINKAKELMSTTSGILEDLSESDVKDLDRQIQVLTVYLKNLNKSILKK